MLNNGKKIKFTILGSGTSSGVPTIGCDCPTCTSKDPKDNRLRCSLLIETPISTIVIDTSPDFRQQMLRSKVKNLDAVVFTHHHFDHIGGFDDIRAFNFHSQKPMPIYLTSKTLIELEKRFEYIFKGSEQIGGGLPSISINLIENNRHFSIGDIFIEPILLYHGRLETLGFRIGSFAFCTDTNNIPSDSLEKLTGLDILVLDALRHTAHSTHFNIEQALSNVNILKPNKTFLIHMTHDILNSIDEKKLPRNVFFSYDGQEIILNYRGKNGQV